MIALDVFSIYQAYGLESQDERRNRENSAAEETTYKNRNTGPDTVTVSNAAIEQYFAMKNSSNPEDADNKNSQYSSSNTLFALPHASKNKKMSSAELLAFLKSDTFSQDAMGYAKSVVYNDLENGDESEPSDQLFTSISDNKKDDSNEENTITDDKNNSNAAFINGNMESERDLAVEIRKVEEEVEELTATYEQIMDGDGSIEEKVRLSKPIGKRLQDRLEDLQNLRAQAKELHNQKLLETA